MTVVSPSIPDRDQAAPPTPTKRPPADVYEVTWMTGHVETVHAHQVSWPGSAAALFGANGVRQVNFHAEINGRWTLILAAREDDIRTIRNVTNGEQIAPDGGVA